MPKYGSCTNFYVGDTVKVKGILSVHGKAQVYDILIDEASRFKYMILFSGGLMVSNVSAEHLKSF